MVKSKDDLIWNLRNAGCPEELINRFLAFYQKNQVREGISLLQRYRCRILENIHAEERKIDRLDYLVFNLEQKGTV